MLQKAPGTCRNKASCNCSTYLRAGDKGRLVGFGCMGWLVGKTGFLFRQLVTVLTWKYPETNPHRLAGHTISILFPIHLGGCLRTIWITTVQTLVLQDKHPVDGHGSSQSVLQGLQFFVPQNSMSLFARNSGSSRTSCPTWTRCSRIFPWTTSTKSMTWAITWDPLTKAMHKTS